MLSEKYRLNSLPRWSLVSCLTVFAATLRFFRLDAQSFWTDEILCVRDASQQFGEVWREVLASPPLYHYILHFVYQFAGKDPFWLRFPSAVFGVLLVPFFYLALERSHGRRTAFWGAVLLSVSPFHIWYSQEARMYSLLALEAFLSMQFWQKALDENRTRDWFFFGVFSLMGLYTHNWFLFLLAGQVIWGYWESHLLRTPVKKFTMTLLYIGLIYLPWIPVLFFKQFPHESLLFLLPTTWKNILTTLWSFSPVGGELMGFYYYAAYYVGSVLAYIGSALVFAAVVSALLLGADKRPVLRHLFAGALIPLSLAFMVSILLKPIFLASRYVMISFPSVLWVVSAGLSVHPGRLGKAMRFLWLALSLYVVGFYFFGVSKKAYWKEIAGEVKKSGAEFFCTRYMNDGVMTDMFFGFYMTVNDRYMNWDVAKHIPKYIDQLESVEGQLVAVVVTERNYDLFLERMRRGWQIMSSSGFWQVRVYYVKRSPSGFTPSP